MNILTLNILVDNVEEFASENEKELNRIRSVKNLAVNIEPVQNSKFDAFIKTLERTNSEYVAFYDDENVLNYKNKVNELQNQIEGSKIELSDDEQYAINQYIGPESYKINEVLRNDINLTKQQEKIINYLDKVLDKMPNYEGAVQRSLMLDKKQLKRFLELHQEGNIIKYKAYTSATAGNRYNDFSNVELLIKSINGKDMRKYNKEEQEILFKRNTKFKVIRKEKIDDIYYIQMEEINE